MVEECLKLWQSRRLSKRESNQEDPKEAGFTGRQSDSAEFGMPGVLAYDLLC